MGTAILSGKISYHLGRGEMVFSSDGSPHQFKALLMLDGFVYDSENHDKLSDITELSWEPSVSVALNDIRIPITPNGHKYKCTSAGDTSSTEPTWPTTAGGTVPDGGATWTEVGPDDQAPTANGYTQNNKILSLAEYLNDPATQKTTVKFDDPSWVAAGGFLGAVDGTQVEIAGIMIVNATPPDPFIVGYYQFSAPGYTADGKGLKGENIVLEIGG